MKKTNLLLALVASAGLLAGCNKAENYFGFGAITNYEVKAEGAIHVQTTSTYVSVVVDKAGKVKNLRIDETQIKVTANGEATALTTPEFGTDGDVKSKWELLEEYGMKGLSTQIGIGKEWYEQAEAFENWAVGKDLAAIKGAMTEDSLTDGAAIGVSVTVDGWVNALEAALVNKIKINGKVAGLGVGAKNSQAALQSNFYVAGAAFDANKNVLGARIDTFQVPYAIVDGRVVVVTEGKVQVVAAENRIKGKHEQGFDYGMKATSSAIPGGVGKEWFEQADSLVAYLVGKTVSAGMGSADTLENGKDIGVSLKVAGYRATLLEAEYTAFNARYTA